MPRGALYIRSMAKTITIGGDLTVNRLGFGAMRVTGPGIWGDPPDPAAARQLLRHAVEFGTDFIVNMITFCKTPESESSKRDLLYKV